MVSFNRSISLESLSTMSRLEAGIQQALAELIKAHRPENGFAVSALERALIIEARARLKLLKTGEPVITK